MSTNPNEIPGAPGFSMPEGLSPEERDAYLLRLRFGPSLFKSGQNFTSAGGDEDTTNPNPNAGPGVVNPAIMQNFLKMANTPAAKPPTHSEQMLQKIIGPSQDASGATPEEAQPQNEDEWAKVNQPGGYGYTPMQQEDYNQFSKRIGGARAYEEQQGKQKVAEQRTSGTEDVNEAKVTELNARAKRENAQAVNPAAPRGAVDELVEQVLGLKPAAAPTTPPAPAKTASAAPPPRQLIGGKWYDKAEGGWKLSKDQSAPKQGA